LIRVNFGSGEQVIERAHAVPGPPGAKELIDESLLVSDEVVLTGARVNGVLSVFPEILRTFPLTDRIVNETHVA
jgi:hypothetical protein